MQYIEQPTARDLAANRQNTMFEAAKLRPVVIDESLTGLDSLLLAREMGYTGAALKACKGQSQIAAAGGGRAEVQDVPLRAGPDLSRRRAGAFRGDRGACAGGDGTWRPTRGSTSRPPIGAGRSDSPAFSMSETDTWIPAGWMA